MKKRLSLRLLKNLIVPALIFLIVLISVVSAVYGEEDFYASTPYAAFDACACSTFQESIRVVNNNPPISGVSYTLEGDELIESESNIVSASTYTISSEGSAASFVSYAPDIFSIVSGEPQDVSAFITVPCNKKGAYTLKTVIRTSGGLEKEISQKINVKQCDNILAAALVNDVKACPWDAAQFQFEITNTQSFLETYSFNVDKFRQYATFSENMIMLQPGETRKIILYMRPAAFSTEINKLFGEHEANLIVTAEGNGISKKVPFYYTIENCYDFDADFGASQLASDDQGFKPLPEGGYEICDASSNVLPVKITNKAETTNNYVVTAKEIPFAMGEQAVDLTGLPRNESYVLEFEIDPNHYLEGNYNFTVTVESVLGMVEKTYDVPLAVRKCFSPKVNISEKIKVTSEPTENVFLLKNIGYMEGNYQLIFEGPEWAELSEDSIRMMPGQEEEISLITSPDETVKEGKYAAKIIVKTVRNNAEYHTNIIIDYNNPNAIQRLYKRLDAYLAGYWVYVIIGIILLLLMIIFLPIMIRRRSKLGKKEYGVYDAQAGDVSYIDVEAPKKSAKPAKEEKAPKTKQKKSYWWLYLILALIVIGAMVAGIFFSWKYYFTAQPAEGNETAAGMEAAEEVAEKAPLAETIKDKMLYLKDWSVDAWYYVSGFFMDFWVYIAIGVGILVLLLIILAVILFVRKRRKAAPKETEKAAAEKEDKQDEKVKDLPVPKKAVRKEKKEKKEKRKINYMKIIGYSLLVIALIMLVFGLYHFRDTIREVWKIPEAQNMTGEEPAEKNVTQTVPAGDHYMDRIISSLDKGQYVFNEQGEVYNRETGKQVTSAELAALFAKNKGKVINETGITESEFNSVVQTLLKMSKSTAPVQVVEEEKEPDLGEVVGVDCDIMIEESSEKIVDLNRMFYDPDNDKLSFKSSKPDNISVEIRDGKATIVPQDGYVGVSYIIFTATDDKGENVTSPKLAICVEETTGARKAENIMQRYLGHLKDFVFAYVNYIVAGIIIVIVLIFFLSYSKEKDGPEEAKGPAKETKTKKAVKKTVKKAVKEEEK